MRDWLEPTAATSTPTHFLTLLRLVKKRNYYRREECNKYDLTAAQYF
jgi:hypothetical protein